MLRDVLTQKGLSNREAEVAELVTKGLSNKEVANQLFVTEKTVKFHLTNIYKKMNVKSRSQLIVWCMPHMSFQEPEAEAISANRPIPAGATTVSSSVAQGPTQLPAQNTISGQPIRPTTVAGSVAAPQPNYNILPGFNKGPGLDGNSGNGGVNSGF